MNWRLKYEFSHCWGWCRADVGQCWIVRSRGGLPVTPKIHTLICGRFAAETDADACQSRLAVQGFGPIQRIHRGEKDVLVCVGQFETNSEAWAVRQEMSRFGFLNVEILAQDDTGDENFRTQFTGPVAPLLVVLQPRFQPVAGTALIVGQAAQPFMDAISRHDRSQVIDLGVSLAESLPDSDPLKAHALIEVGRAIVQRDKESANALPYLLKVASGDVTATEKDLIGARFMVADSWHYYWFAPLKAYRAYKEILASHGDSPDVSARCMVEMAACLLELARMPDREWRASFDDVRRMCLRIHADVPRGFDRVHAVADLIYAETFLYQTPPDLQTAHEAFEGYDERYPGRTRELSMANHLRGYIAAETGDWENARRYYERNIGLNISSPGDLFYWKGDAWNMKERSAKRLAHYSGQFGDKATEEKYKSYLEEKRYLDGVPPAAGFDTAFPHIFYMEVAD